MGIYMGTCKHLVMDEESFVIYKLFSKRIVNYKDIDVKESKYLSRIGEGNKLLPKKGIFKSNETLFLKLKNGEALKVNLNFLLYSGAYIELYLVITKKLKINRVMS